MDTLVGFSATQPNSICAWIYSMNNASVAGPDFRFAWLWSQAAGSGFGLALNASSDDLGVIYGSVFVSYNFVLPRLAWTHVCVQAPVPTGVAPNTSLVVNGTVYSPATAEPNFSDHGGQVLAIGGNRSPYKSWWGRIARVSFWKLGLSGLLARLPSEMVGDFSVRDSTLVSYAPLNEGFGKDVKDSVTNKYYYLPYVDHINNDLSSAYAITPNPFSYPKWVSWTCGNGIVEPWEQCDEPSSSLCTQCERLHAASRHRPAVSMNGANVYDNLVKYSSMHATDGLIWPDATPANYSNTNGAGNWVPPTSENSKFIIDLGSMFTIAKVRIMNGNNAAAFDRSVRDFLVIASNNSDGTSGIDVISSTFPTQNDVNYFLNNPDPPGGWAEWWPSTTNLQTRYVIFASHTYNGQYGASLLEVEVLTQDLPRYEVVSRYSPVVSTASPVLAKSGADKLTDGIGNDFPSPWLIACPGVQGLTYFTVDLRTAKTIHGFHIQNTHGSDSWSSLTETTTNLGDGTANFRIATSLDNVNFETVLGGTLQRQNYIGKWAPTGSSIAVTYNPSWETFTIPERSARFVRFYADSCYGSYAGLSEFEVFSLIRPPINVLLGECISSTFATDLLWQAAGAVEKQAFALNDGAWGHSDPLNGPFQPYGGPGDFPPYTSSPHTLSDPPIEIAIPYNVTITKVVVQPSQYSGSALKTIFLTGTVPGVGAVTVVNATYPLYNEPTEIPRFEYPAYNQRFSKISFWLLEHYGAYRATSEIAAFSEDPSLWIPISDRWIKSITPNNPSTASFFDGRWNDKKADSSVIVQGQSLTIILETFAVVSGIRVQPSAGLANDMGAFSFQINVQGAGQVLMATNINMPDRRSGSSPWQGPERGCNPPIIIPIPPIWTNKIFIVPLLPTFRVAFSEIQILAANPLTTRPVNYPVITPDFKPIYIGISPQQVTIPGGPFNSWTAGVPSNAYRVWSSANQTISADLVDDWNMRASFEIPMLEDTPFLVTYVRGYDYLAYGPVQVGTLVGVHPFEQNRRVNQVALPTPVTWVGEHFVLLNSVEVSKGGSWSSLANTQGDTTLSMTLAADQPLGPVICRFFRGTWTSRNYTWGEVIGTPAINESSVVIINNAQVTIFGENFPTEGNFTVPLRVYYSNDTGNYIPQKCSSITVVDSTTLICYTLFDVPYTGEVVFVEAQAAVGNYSSAFVPIGTISLAPSLASGPGRFFPMATPNNHPVNISLSGANFDAPSVDLHVGIISPWSAVVESPLYNGDETAAILDIFSQAPTNFTALGLAPENLTVVACDVHQVHSSITATCQLSLPSTGFLFAWVTQLSYASEVQGLTILTDRYPTVTPATQYLSTTAPSITISGTNLDTSIDGSLSISIQLDTPAKRAVGVAPTCTPALSNNTFFASSISCDLTWSINPEDRQGGTLTATVSSHGIAIAPIQIAALVPAPTISGNGDTTNFAENAASVTIKGQGFLPGPQANDHQVTLSFGNVTAIRSVTATEIVLDVSNLQIGPLDVSLTLYQGLALVDNQGSRVPAAGYLFLANIVPAPVVNGSIDNLPFAPAAITILGVGFDHNTPTTTQVELTLGASTEVIPCTVTSSTENTVICTPGAFTNNASTLILATVYAFGGPSAPVIIGIVAAPPPVAPQTAPLGPVEPSAPGGAPGFEPPVAGQIDGAVVGGGVGGGLGGLLLIGLVIFLVIFLLRKRKAKKDRKDLPNTAEMVMHETAAKPEANYTDILGKWDIPFADLTLGKKIGRGGFGVVYAGNWRETKVAIKEAVLETPEARRAFMDETELTLKLRPHKNVVQTFGVAQNQETGVYYLVLELCFGSLEKVVYNSENLQRMTEKNFISYAKHIARGMHHLAQERITHRDLACRNILLAKDGTPKISDFGMSRVTEAEKEGTTASGVGAVAWMAPESINRKFSQKSDVWMYGCTIWEILAGEPPHQQFSDNKLELALKIRDEGYHPVISDSYPPILQQILAACWKYEPDERPTFKQILKMLSSGKRAKDDQSDQEDDHDTAGQTSNASVFAQETHSNQTEQSDQ